VVGGYVVANAVKPLLALVTSWVQILGIRFADRFAKGVRGTARDVMVAESVDKSAIGSAYGLIQAMDSAGAIAGPLLALALIGHFGMRGVFAFAAVPGALAILVAWLGIREVGSKSQFSVLSSRFSVFSCQFGLSAVSCQL
jgi:MFS family permease